MTKDNKDGLLTLDIKVSIARVWPFTEKVYIDPQFAKENEIDTEFIKATILTKIPKKDQVRFNASLKKLLSDNFKESLSDEEFNKQKQEILFAATYLKKLTIPLHAAKDSKDFQTFSQIVEILNQANHIEKGTTFNLSFSKTTEKNLTSVDLPIPYDSKHLYSYLANSILSYFTDNAQSIQLRFYLKNGYKQEITIDLLNKTLERIKKQRKPHPDSVLGLYMYTMLPYLKKLPQFRANNLRDNSVLTEPQASFFNTYFSLFGFYNQDFKIHLDFEAGYKTNKQLRVILKRYLAFCNIS